VQTWSSWTVEEKNEHRLNNASSELNPKI
jgi:hypothetical protein